MSTFIATEKILAVAQFRAICRVTRSCVCIQCPKVSALSEAESTVTETVSTLNRDVSTLVETVSTLLRQRLHSLRQCVHSLRREHTN